MLYYTFSLVAVLLLAAAAYLQAEEKTPPAAKDSVKSIYDFTVIDIDSTPVKLDKYKGHVMLIVNVASKCGFTPQYEGLEKLYRSYKENGLVVLGFPANNFLKQEPGTDAQIKEFCTLTYGVTFPMFSKISVDGKDQHPLYAWLTSKKSNPEFAGDISWNFNKFLIGRDGKILARFGSQVKPNNEELVKAVKNALARINSK
jgi:glutathione peroxidase